MLSPRNELLRQMWQVAESLGQADHSYLYADVTYLPVWSLSELDDTLVSRPCNSHTDFWLPPVSAIAPGGHLGRFPCCCF